MFSTAGDMAQISSLQDLQKFMVYLHITPGVVDDFEEVKKELENLYSYPISIIIIRIKDSSIDEKENIRIRELIEGLSTWQQRRRIYISYYEIGAKDSKHEIEKLMKNIRLAIIYHIESYLELFRFEIAGSILSNDQSSIFMLDGTVDSKHPTELTSFNKNDMSLPSSINDDSDRSEEVTQELIIERIAGRMEMKWKKFDNNLQQLRRKSVPIMQPSDYCSRNSFDFESNSDLQNLISTVRNTKYRSSEMRDGEYSDSYVPR